MPYETASSQSKILFNYGRIVVNQLTNIIPLIIDGYYPFKNDGRLLSTDEPIYGLHPDGVHMYTPLYHVEKEKDDWGYSDGDIVEWNSQEQWRMMALKTCSSKFGTPKGCAAYAALRLLELVQDFQDNNISRLEIIADKHEAFVAVNRSGPLRYMYGWGDDAFVLAVWHTNIKQKTFKYMSDGQDYGCFWANDPRHPIVITNTHPSRRHIRVLLDLTECATSTNYIR
ncbi:MAG: hypothetical protein KAH18_00475 [Psychromonas sp.]|nr:hypothetical protein [Psychromonas sp.]